MFELTRENLASFKSRFNCFDGLVQRFEIVFSQDRGRAGELEILVRDADESWIKLLIRVHGLTEAHFIEGKSTIAVMTDGLDIEWVDGIFFIVFSPYTDEPESVEDLRKADGFLAGDCCDWEIVKNT